MKKKYNYILLAIGIWSTQAFATKILVTALGPILVYFLASILAGTTLLIFFFLLNKKASLNSLFRRFRQVIIISALLSAANLMLFTSFALMQASGVIIILYIYPIFMVVMNSVIFTKKVEVRELVGILIGFLGILIFTTNGTLTTFRFENTFGYLLVLGGAFFWALYLIVQRHFQLETVSSNGIAFLLSAVYALPLLLLVSTHTIINHFDIENVSLLIYLGMITFGMANVLYITGLKKSKIINAALTNYLTPVMAVVLNFLVLGESIFWYDFAPIACVFIGYVTIEWKLVKRIIFSIFLFHNRLRKP